MGDNIKILSVNTDDITGGAAIATYRLHQGLQNNGIESELFVMRKVSDDDIVVKPVAATDTGDFFYRSLMPAIDRLPFRKGSYKKNTEYSRRQENYFIWRNKSYKE